MLRLATSLATPARFSRRDGSQATFVISKHMEDAVYDANAASREGSSGWERVERAADDGRPGSTSTSYAATSRVARRSLGDDAQLRALATPPASLGKHASSISTSRSSSFAVSLFTVGGESLASASSPSRRTSRTNVAKRRGEDDIAFARREIKRLFAD